MADISMCNSGKICKVSENCYRHTAKPSVHLQSYSDFKPNGEACEYYWPNNPKVYKVVLQEGKFKVNTKVRITK